VLKVNIEQELERLPGRPRGRAARTQLVLDCDDGGEGLGLAYLNVLEQAVHLDSLPLQDIPRYDRYPKGHISIQDIHDPTWHISHEISRDISSLT
jgi:hypothetical protein